MRSVKESIVVGVDGSSTALVAAERAAAIAAALGAEVHLLTAYSADTAKELSVGSDTMVFTAAQDAERVVGAVSEHLAELGLPVTSSSAVKGKPAEVLIEQADERHATLIVVGNRGMQGLARILGSVANDVSHHAPCDVLVVKTA